MVGLTGTPGNLMDLWAEIGILDMGQRLGRYIGAYRDRFFLPDKRNRNIIYSNKPRDGAEEAIYNLISDICISMKAEDYLSMPECLYHRVEVRMDEKEEKLYRQMEKDMLLPFEDGDVDAVNAAALSGKLLQMANGAVYDENHKVRHIHDKKHLFSHMRIYGCIRVLLYLFSFIKYKWKHWKQHRHSPFVC